MLSGIRSKRILFILGNFFPEPTGIGKYNGEMVDFFARNGFHCTVITSYPYYPYWQVQEPYSKRAFWYKKETRITYSNLWNPIEIYRCPQYVPKNPSGFKRMMLDFSFCCFSFLKVFQLLFTNRFDYVFTVVPCFQVGLLGTFYKKLRGGKFIYHIQDLQIDAARELQMIKSRVVIRGLLHIERYILRNADVISSISAGMIKKIQDKCNRDVVLFPNWADTKAFYPLTEQGKLKEEYHLKPTDKVVLYSGAIGEKQGLENLLDVAKAFSQKEDVKFVICGSGPYKEKLERQATEWQLANIVFLPTQPAEKLNHLLNMADVHLVLQKANASDLVMPSKLTTILSVGGLAIVSACPNTNLYELIASHAMGILVFPDNRQSLSDAIGEALKRNFEYMKRNARKYAEEHLSIERIFPKFLECVQ